MRVLLTGATGFVGSRVLPLLGAHDVLCLTRRPDRVVSDHARAVAADLGSDGGWTNAVRDFKPDWCVHLAWEGLPDYSLDACRRNVDAGLRLFDVALRAGARRFVVAGSCWEYGRATGAVTEDTEPVGLGVFAAAKRALMTVLARIAGDPTDYRWARCFFVYGPGQRENSLIPSLRAALKNGRAPEVREPRTKQDFIHVDDAAGGIVSIAEAETSPGAFNVGTGAPVSVAYVANRVASHYKAKPPFADEVNGTGFWADTRRTAAATGWRSRIGIDEGIAMTLESMDAGRTVHA